MALRLVLILLCQLCLLGLGSAVPLSALDALDKLIRKRATLPNDDPFYQAPDGFDSQPPGTILRSRAAPTSITLTNTSPLNLKAAIQILYRTQNSVGQPEATVMTVLIPYNANVNHLYSYSYFSDAAYNACSPSIALQVGVSSDNTFVQRQTANLVIALQQGYIVTVADDEGPQAAFAAGLGQAYATMDSIRAALASTSITGLSATATTTITGYSGGSLPTEYMVELMADYAPELKIAGAAIGGLFPDFNTYVLNTINKANSDLVVVGIMGMAQDYANLSSWISDNVKPDYRDKLYATYSQCFYNNTAMYANQDIGDYFVNGLTSLFNDPVPGSVLNSTGRMGLRNTPNIPLYIYSSASDELSPVNLTDALVNKYCDAGASITYERNTAAGVTHGDEGILGVPGSFQWLVDRHNGVPAATGCSVSNISQETVQAVDSGLIGYGILGLLEALLEAPVGADGFGDGFDLSSFTSNIDLGFLSSKPKKNRGTKRNKPRFVTA